MLKLTKWKEWIMGMAVRAGRENGQMGVATFLVPAQVKLFRESQLEFHHLGK